MAPVELSQFSISWSCANKMCHLCPTQANDECFCSCHKDSKPIPLTEK